MSFSQKECQLSDHKKKINNQKTKDQTKELVLKCK